MTSSNGNIFRVTGPLCGEFTGPGEFPTQMPVPRSFDVFFDLHLNKRLSKQSWGWWFRMLLHPLWHHCNTYFLYCHMHSQYHGGWWPGDARSQGISSNDIDLVIPKYAYFSTRGLNLFVVFLITMESLLKIDMILLMRHHTWQLNYVISTMVSV